MYSKNVYLKYIFPILGLAVLALLLISRALVSGSFDDIWDTISGLGDATAGNNPNGAIYFQIALAVLGLLCLLTVIYVHPKMAGFLKGWTRVGSLWLLIGSIGFFLVGFVPAETGRLINPKFHEICAGVGAVGVLLASVCYIFAMWQPGKPKNKLLAFIVGFVQMIFGITGIFFLIDCFKVAKGKTIERLNKKVRITIDIMWWLSIWAFIVFYAIATLYYQPLNHLGWYSHSWAVAGVPFIFSFSFWERIIFAEIIFYQGLLVAAMPEK